MPFDYTYLENLCGIKEKRRKDLVSYFNKLSEDIRYEVLKHQKEATRQNQKKRVKGKEEEYTYAMFLVGIQKLRTYENTLLRANESISPKELLRIETIRASRIKTRKPHSSQRDTVRCKIETNYIPLVKRLRNQKLSWRKICDYLARYHRIRLSHTHLKKIFEGHNKFS